MKKNLLLLFSASLVLSGCTTTFEISSGDESLSALTKVTDSKEPCVTPYGGDNGSALYFAARENKRFFNIYKKDNPFSNAMAQKTSGRNFNMAPVYSPANDKIAFRCQNEGSSTSDIFMMSGSRGKALSQITETDNAFENHPSLSSNGKMLVYDKQTYNQQTSIWLFGLANTVLLEKSEIWIKNLETGESTLLTNGYQPRYSPDDSKIVFTRYSSDAKSCSIWVMDSDGENQVQLTDAKKGYAFCPCWAPNGDKIIFQSTQKDKKDADLYIVDLNGENLVQLTANKSSDCEPYWTKDNYIYFSSDRGNKKGNLQIWRFKLSE